MFKMDIEDKNYRLQSGIIQKKLSDIILGVIYNNSLYNKDKDNSKMEYVLYNLYAKITNNSLKKIDKPLLKVEELYLNTILNDVNKITNERVKNEIPLYYKILLKKLSQNKSSSYATSLTNVYNKILEIDKENQNNKITSKPKVIERSI